MSRPQSGRNSYTTNAAREESRLFHLYGESEKKQSPAQKKSRKMFGRSKDELWSRNGGKSGCIEKFTFLHLYEQQKKKKAPRILREKKKKKKIRFFLSLSFSCGSLKVFSGSCLCLCCWSELVLYALLVSPGIAPFFGWAAVWKR